MKQSQLFYTDAFKKIEQNVKSCLNKQRTFLSERSVESTRAVGDAIESVLADNFREIIGDFAVDYSSSFARRAMADFAFTDRQGFYYVVDVKTHRLDTKFNMPNLTSVERLARFYEEDENNFCILKVDYEFLRSRLVIRKVVFAPIEFLSWNCLTLGALGWGQIQIANANSVEVIQKNNRKKWMLELCEALLDFYPKEIDKIGERVKYFKKIKKYWKAKVG